MKKKNENENSAKLSRNGEIQKNVKPDKYVLLYRGL